MSSQSKKVVTKQYSPLEKEKKDENLLSYTVNHQCKHQQIDKAGLFPFVIRLLFNIIGENMKKVCVQVENSKISRECIDDGENFKGMITWQ